MEIKVEIQKNPLSKENLKKLNDIQQKAEDIDTVQEIYSKILDIVLKDSVNTNPYV
jgi:hypothetical protein